ncbi:MAG: MurT ligase domain-containing protein [Clostridiales bacterium]|jgi:UDP-N-acetylmuramyl tripeptide synthase|nr:MurT ligase domain-containing protein [Clostridiales bacterium]
MNLRLILAIWTCKISSILGRAIGKKSSATPGGIALKICPNIIRILSKNIDKIIVVCGTNGKTTTNNIINSILKNKGKTTVCNNLGANMLSGIATIFASTASVFGKLKADVAVLEIDEFSARIVFDHLTPDIMAITNLFRDQLDRYGEIDIAINALQEAIDKTNNLKLVLNADDPLSSSFSLENGEVIYYGIDTHLKNQVNAPNGLQNTISVEKTNENTDENTEAIKLKSVPKSVTDGLFCRQCGAALEYSEVYYNQLGKYSCPECGFVRPTPTFEATNLKLYPKIEFNIADTRISVHYKGFYNIYNILAAYSAVALLTNEENLDINEVLSEYKPQIGRMQPYVINKLPFVFNLSKNPAGFNQAIATVEDDLRQKCVVIVINDNEQDGTDISWIWDVDFERLTPNEIFISGTRRFDVAVRLKYAEFTNYKVFDTTAQAIDEAIAKKYDISYILVNYTALFSTENILKSKGEVA